MSPPEREGDTETEVCRKAMTAFIEHCVQSSLEGKCGALLSAPSGLSFRFCVAPVEGEQARHFSVRLFLSDPKQGGGLERSTKTPKGAYAYESGIVAGLNHNYMELYCNTCFRRDCPANEISCVYSCGRKSGEPQHRTLIAEAEPVKVISPSQETLHEEVQKVLKFAFSMKLCICKQWFATEGNALCASCLAASAMGATASCIVCHEPATKRTRCCKQAMHAACHEHHTENSPTVFDAPCPACRAESYGLD